jgi:hypothetical protein
MKAGWNFLYSQRLTKLLLVFTTTAGQAGYEQTARQVGKVKGSE